MKFGDLKIGDYFTCTLAPGLFKKIKKTLLQATCINLATNQLRYISDIETVYKIYAHIMEIDTNNAERLDPKDYVCYTEESFLETVEECLHEDNYELSLNYFDFSEIAQEICAKICKNVTWPRPLDEIPAGEYFVCDGTNYIMGENLSNCWNKDNSKPADLMYEYKYEDWKND